MWLRAWALLLLPMAALGDLKIVSRDTAGGSEITLAQRRQGSRIRVDRGDSATIVNVADGSTYVLDLRNRTWTPQRSHDDPLLVLASWMWRPPRVRESGKTVEIWYETMDTGERREMFGRTASHLITRERRVAEPGACTGSSETETDGWYIPPESPRRYAAYVLGSNHACRDTMVTHGARPINGLPLLETVRDGTGTRIHEVTEYSEQPLDPALFAPPGDFRRVDSSETWVGRVGSDLQQVERAFESWFD
jgi:hypothetical protein